MCTAVFRKSTMRQWLSMWASSSSRLSGVFVQRRTPHIPCAFEAAGPRLNGAAAMTRFIRYHADKVMCQEMEGADWAEKHGVKEPE